MPALPAVPGGLRVALAGDFDGASQWVTRFYLHYTGTAPTGANLNTFATSLTQSFNSFLVPLCSTIIILRTAEVIDISSPTSAEGLSPTTATGTRPGGLLPAAACFVTSYETARRYRGGHSRGYWPFGVTTDVNLETAWSTAFVSNVGAQMNAFFANVFSNGWSGAGTLSHINISYYSGFEVVISPTTGRARNVNVLRSVPLVDPITSIVPRASIGTQRRRAHFVD